MMKKLFKLIFGKTSVNDYVPLKKYSELKGKELPLVSYILPARNEEKSITKCIEAIINDKYPKTEIIVVDDLSTDRTPEIVSSLKKKYSKKVKIKYIKNENRIGPGQTRNVGFLASKGDVVIMFDAHSIIVSSDFTKKYLAYFVDKKVGAVVGSRAWKPKLYQDKILYYAGGVRPWREMGFQFLDTPNSAFRRSVFIEMGMIDKELVWGSDLSNTSKILSLGYKIPVAKDVVNTIDHSITPNRKIDFFRKNFLYGTVTPYILFKHFKWYWKRKVDLRIIFGGLLNLGCIIAFLVNFKLWFLPVASIALTRAHSMAFAIYYMKVPFKYFIGIPIILTISDISYGVGFLYGCLRKTLGLRSFYYKKTK